MKTPKIATKILSWFIKDSLYEEVLGDLEESYNHNLEKFGKAKANRLYWYQVLNYFRPFAVRGLSISSPLGMYGNYMKVGVRTFRKEKGYSLINVGGLAVGMMVAILTGLWVEDEISHNKNHSNYETLGKIYRTNTWKGETETSYSHVTGLGTLLGRDYSNLFDHVAMVRARTEYRVLSREGRKFRQSGYFIEAEGPEMFSLEMIYGTKDGLTDMRTIFLAESTSKKLFGDKIPLGETITIDGEWELKVTGVYKDLPKNSEFHDATYFAPLTWYLYGWSDIDAWDNYHMYIYVNLAKGQSFSAASEIIADVMLPHVNEGTAATNPTIFIHPMKDWHLNSEFENGVLVLSKRMQFLMIFGAIGLFVLTLACINFVNLSTARAEKRSREVGIRKSIGSQRRQLISQFLTESFLMVSLSFVLSLILVQLLLPAFNVVAGKTITIVWSNPVLWISSFVFIALTSLLAGSYPAFYLSSFNPLKVLKGHTGRGGSALPRKILVVFQFTISMILLIGTIGIYQQIEFGKDRPVGYAREGLIELRPRSPEYYASHHPLRNELLATNMVHEVGQSNYSITSTLGWNHGFHWEGREESYNPAFNTINVTHEYGDAVGLEFIEGRNFSREGGADKNGILINESALEMMGLEDPIGQVISYDTEWKDLSHHTIVGVFKDMIKGSPFEATDPSVLFLKEEAQHMLYIRIKDGVSPGEALPVIGKVFNKHVPSAPFDFKFADDEYNAKFRDEESLGTLAAFFCAVAILISCLGLLGLSSFVAEQRTKEIGIRKVLGASTMQVWQMLSREFIVLVILSCLVSIPISILFLNGWLANYEYKTIISTWLFIIAALGAMLITLITVSFQSIRAALTNPVDSLSSE